MKLCAGDSVLCYSKHVAKAGENTRNLNLWQELSAATYGFVTPGNIISFIGGVLIVLGFLQIVNESWFTGVVLVGLGRLMDILDGHFARLTKTTNTLGEFVDVVTDKLVALFALVVILRHELIPAFIILLIAFQNIVNVAAFSIAARRKSDKLGTHVSRFGKLATFYSWVTIVCFLAARGLELNDQSGLQAVAQVAGYGFFILFLRFGFMASLDYFRRAV